VRKVRNTHKNYGAKPERKIPISRPRHFRECNNIRDMQGIGYKDVGWINLA
jgi:hypothetical protein